MNEFKKGDYLRVIIPIETSTNYDRVLLVGEIYRVSKSISGNIKVIQIEYRPDLLEAFNSFRFEKIDPAAITKLERLINGL